MGIKIAVACEDPTWDQFILAPVLKAALKACQKPNARLEIIRNPHSRGFDNLLQQACEILDRYGGISDVVIFAVDLDCEDGTAQRRDKLLRLRNQIERCGECATNVIVVGARQELEVWCLWGAKGEINARWEEIAADCHPKERFFEPLLTPADELRPDGGRSRLIEKSLQSGWESIRTGCPELHGLETDLLAVL